MTLFGVAACVLTLAAAPQRPGHAQLFDEARPLAVDYFAMRKAIGPAAFGKLLREASEEYRQRQIGRGGDCLSEREIRAYQGATLAAMSASAEAFTADRAAGEALVAQLDLQWRRLEAGEKAPGFENASAAIEQSRGAKDRRLRELFLRQARDQFVRADVPAVHVDPASPGKNLPALYASQILSARMCEVDRANTAWLRSEWKRRGWFTLSKYGQAAGTAAFLIVQHADRDREFQRESLARLEALVAKGEAEPRTYAYLFDRLATADNRPQRYGTQGRCVGAGIWEPNVLEDREQLDARRATVGLGPESEYKARLKDLCR